jgi:PAP_fibrillin
MRAVLTTAFLIGALSCVSHVDGLQNLIPNSLRSVLTAAVSVAPSSPRFLEDELLKAIQDLGDENRLANSERIRGIVAKLEATPSIPRPAIHPSVYGRWRLLHTNNADTASPIQRKAVSSSALPIYQDIVVNDEGQLIVSQVVKFGENAKLRVDALASTSAYPLAELTDRNSDGKIFGLNILGVSAVGEEAKEDDSRPDSRINFVFDDGKFEFGDRLFFPYPVPFRIPILRDAVKGWIDITYLSERVRISRGNKGTTFILTKEID